MNYYKKAISIVADDTIDFRSLCIEAAKNNPCAIVKAAERLGVKTESKWITEIRELAKISKIKAIRLYREYTNCSLIDAKKFVESL